MAGTASEDSGAGRSSEGISSGQQRSQSMEALAEWRSSEQLENGIPSTSPPYWDTDDEDECGPKPSELYGKYTWKIDKFSQINKRDLRSNAFEVGGYKWYILIYPQGCDVCNHLSLFLCVANHDKLLPGWSHFAQFTIAVVNKDPKKSKYSDTLHRFWKKEHDWGWKKFMELSKVLDGFIDADTLIIKAQVQVIRERADRLFRCLDCQYRRELVRVYLTNVEQICRRFVEERRAKLLKLIEDKARWSSFCAFWLSMDQSTRRRMTRERRDSILRVVVKHFFIEKEVTSTLVMDSLYSGLKALEGQTKGKSGREKHLNGEELPVPIVCTEKDIFVLVDDVLLLLERAAMEPLPPKDEKGPQNRTKDGSSGDCFNKDSIEHDERRLTELGRRTIEIFVLAHIFSKIEVAYQEAVALKRQEELIREEEAAWLAESEQKAKRGPAEREKKSKKKQAKQKKNNRKGKDKGREEKPDLGVQDKYEEESPIDERKDLLIEEAESVLEKPEALEDLSDLSDAVDSVPEMLHPDSEDRYLSPITCDTDTSVAHPPTETSRRSGLSAVQNGKGRRESQSLMDDSSSTCSTDSVPSVVTNGPSKANILSSQNAQKSFNSGRIQRGKGTCDSTSSANETSKQRSEAAYDVGQPNYVSGSFKASESDPWSKRNENVEEVVSLERKPSYKDEAVTERRTTEKTAPASPPTSPPKVLSSAVQKKTESKASATAKEPVAVKKPSSDIPKQIDRAATTPINPSEITVVLRPDTNKLANPKPVEKPIVNPLPAMSRPLSAPLSPGPRHAAPVVSMVQMAPSLARSVSAAGRLGLDPSPATHSSVPQSYRNAIMGNPISATSSSFSQPHPPPSSPSSTPLNSQYTQPSPNLISAPIFSPQRSERLEPNSIGPGFSFGMVNHDVFQNGPPKNYGFFEPMHARTEDPITTGFPAGTSGRQSQGTLADEFPHLDIINDLLDDEQGAGPGLGPSFQSFRNGPYHLSRQFTFPSEMGMSTDLGPSTSSSKFERTRSYRDDGGFQRGGGGYGPSSRGQFDHLGDMISQQHNHHSLGYGNGQVIDGLISNQWQMPGSDLPYISMGNNQDSESYHPYYSNPNQAAGGVGGYPLFRPSNGH